THLIPTSLELSRKNKECGSTLLSDAFEVDLCFSVVVFQLSVFSSRFSAYFGGIAGCVASGGGGSYTGLPSRRLSSMGPVSRRRAALCSPILTPTLWLLSSATWNNFRPSADCRVARPTRSLASCAMRAFS